MTYEQLKSLKANAFKRKCGVQRETFEQMAEVLHPHLDRSGKRGGQAKLSVEDQLLLVLEYWREYRTQFHIATSWGISESAVCRKICEGGKAVDAFWQVSTAWQKAAISECSYLERRCC